MKAKSCCVIAETVLMRGVIIALLLSLQFEQSSQFTPLISKNILPFQSTPCSLKRLSQHTRTTSATWIDNTLSCNHNNQSFHLQKITSTSLSLSTSPSPPSSSTTKYPSNSAATSLDNLQTKLVFQTLTRIAIPSLSAAFLCFLTFSPTTHAIFTYVQTSFNGVETGTGYEALNLILTDNSNQFIQNAHNFFALNFCFLTTYTFSFLYNNQVKLYQALYDEVGTLISLLEQVALSTEGRLDLYKLLLLCIRKYINDDLKFVTKISSHTISSDSESDLCSTTTAGSLRLSNIDQQDLPVLLVSQRPQHDPLETILYLTSVGQPSHVYSTIKSLRQARANRLASLQRKMPEVNMYLLYILGFSAWVTFPIVTAGSSTVGGEALINVYRDELSLGIFAMGCVLGIINELKQPEVGSAYNVDYNLLGKLMDGLDDELDYRLAKCGLLDENGGSKFSERQYDELSSRLVANTLEMSGNMKGNDDDDDDDEVPAIAIQELSNITPPGVEHFEIGKDKKEESNSTRKKSSWFRRRILRSSSNKNKR